TANEPQPLLGWRERRRPKEPGEPIAPLSPSRALRGKAAVLGSPRLNCCYYAPPIHVRANRQPPKRRAAKRPSIERRPSPLSSRRSANFPSEPPVQTRTPHS